VGKRVQVGFLHAAIYESIKSISKCTTVIIPPTVLKKYVTGKGNAPKDLMLEGVIKKWFEGNIPNLGKQDLYEAYALAKLGELVVCGTAPEWVKENVLLVDVYNSKILNKEESRSDEKKNSKKKRSKEV
jgi:hypothetical protein